MLSITKNENLSGIRPSVTNTHHFGYMLTPESKSFGVINISKNASSNLRADPRISLSCQARIASFKGPIFCLLRDPIKRFLSSIPETIYRVRIGSDKNIYPLSRSTSISYDIANQLEFLDVGNIDLFIHSYIDIINQYGFFDAHHEPQTYFLTNKNGDALSNIICFDINQYDHFISYLFNKNLISSHTPLITRKNLGDKGDDLILRMKKIIKAKLLGLDVEYVSSDSNLIKSLNDVGSRSKLYSQLKSGINDYHIIRIKSLYEDDLRLYKRLCK